MTYEESEEMMAEDMMEDTEEYLRVIARNSRIQVEEAKKQTKLAKVRTTVICLMSVLMIVAGIFAGTKINGLVTSTNDVLDQVEQIDVDKINGLIGQVDSFMEKDADKITDALQKVGNLDIDSLNSAIQSLSNVVGGLSGLFGS